MKHPQSPTLRRVLANNTCSGCGLCAAVSNGDVTMGDGAPGYARPYQRAPLDELAERTIAGSCPGVVVEPWAHGSGTDPYWGPCRDVMTGHAVDERLRFRASSGGALSALVVHALRVGLIDRAVHVVADIRYPTRNRVAVSDTEEAIIQGAGSRYSASSPLEVIDTQLGLGGRFAIVGKPCDISALRRLGRLDDRVSRHVALAMSFFCAGIPSYAAADRVLDALGVRPGEVEAFRYRGFGWPGEATAMLSDGTSRRMSYADSWGGVLSKEVQFRCKICPDAVGGVADVACADAWLFDERGGPAFDEAEGRSLILSRTAAGQELIASAIAAGTLVAEPLDVRQIEQMQPSQARRKRLVRARMLGLAATLQAAPSVDGTYVREASRKAGVREQAHNLLGTMRRVLLRTR